MKKIFIPIFFAGLLMTGCKDGDPGPTGADGAAGANGANGSKGETGIAGTGFNNIIKDGNVLVTLSGKRPDNVSFTSNQDFKYVPDGGSPAEYARVNIDKNSGTMIFEVVRYLGNVDEDHNNNYVSIVFEVTSAGVISPQGFNLHTAVIDGDKNFGIVESDFSTLALTGYSYNATAGNLKFNFTVNFPESNSTGYDLSVSGVASVNVYEAVADRDPYLYGFYALNGNADDASGHGNNGIINGVTTSTDRFANVSGAYHFDGSSFISIQKQNPTTLGLPLTIAAWFSIDGATTPQQTILSMGRSSNGTGFNFGYTVDGGQGKIFLGFIGGNGPVGPFTNVNLVAGTWHHLAGTFDSEVIRLYFDGILVAKQTVSKSDAYSIQQTLTNSSQNIEIGRELQSLGRYFYGDIDDVMIYRQVLTDTEILAIYKTPFELNGE